MFWKRISILKGQIVEVTVSWKKNQKVRIKPGRHTWAAAKGVMADVLSSGKRLRGRGGKASSESSQRRRTDACPKEGQPKAWRKATKLDFPTVTFSLFSSGLGNI